MAIVSKVFMLIFSVLIGFGQGYQPVAGYNYGAKRYDRVREAFLFMSVSATVFMAICAVPGYLAARHLIRLFIGNDADDRPDRHTGLTLSVPDDGAAAIEHLL